MKTLLAISLLVIGGATVIAQPSLCGNSVRSVSGQFVVHDRRANPSGPSSTTGPGLMDLEPTVLVVSCERIKQALAKGTLVRTNVRPLDGEGRREEVARMLAGAQITAEARAAASKLLSDVS